jgi:hypothetical protein
MYDRVTQLKKEIEQSFGTHFTSDQMWTLVKLCKHVRMRCRNNAAFNNFFNAAFPNFRFAQVTKKRQDGSTYPGLRITNLAGEEVIGGEDEEE